MQRNNIAEKKIQDFIDALRNKDYENFIGILQFLNDKYRPIAGKNEIASEELLPILHHELLHTDVAKSDLTHINILSNILFDNFLSVAQGNVGFVLTTLQSISFLIAARELNDDKFISSNQIVNNSDFEKFIKENKSYVLSNEIDVRKQKISQETNFLDDKGDAEKVEVEKNGAPVLKNKMDVEVSRYFNENVNSILLFVFLRNLKAGTLALFLRDLEPEITDYKNLFQLIIPVLLSNQILEQIDKSIRPLIPNELRDEFNSQMTFALMQPRIIAQQLQLKMTSEIQGRALVIKTELKHELANHGIDAYLEKKRRIAAHAISNVDVDTQPVQKKSKTKSEKKSKENELSEIKNPLLQDSDLHAQSAKDIQNDIEKFSIAQAKREIQQTPEYQTAKYELTLQIIRNIRNYIETTNWEFRLGGIGAVVVDGQRYPTTVALILNTCKLVDQNNSAQNPMHVYEQIQKIAHDAHNSFSLFRRKSTQQFYSDIASIHTNQSTLKK